MSMPMSVVYATVNGRLVQENRGGVVTRYIADTLGSVIQTRDAAGNQTSSTTYWPFGEIRTQTGTNPSPWGFVGTLGYYRDAAARLYVRARMLRTYLSRWMSVDPLWPRETAYNYAKSEPTSVIDPSGTLPMQALLCGAACITTGGCLAGVWIACGALWGEPEWIDCVTDYIASLPPQSQYGCLLGVVGCFGCIVSYITRCKKPVCPPSVKAPLDGAVNRICKPPGVKRACKPGDNCTTLRGKTANISACITARLAVMFVCFAGGDKGHWTQVGQETTMIGNCLGLMKGKGCAPFGKN